MFRGSQVKKLLWIAVAITLGACSEDKPSGPVDVQVIRPVGGHCAYRVEPARVETLDSLIELRGALGQVVTSNQIVDTNEEFLDSFANFKPVATQFSHSGSVYAPLDYTSLFGVSLYYAVEATHLLFSRLDPATDLVAKVPDLGVNTRIVYNALRTYGEPGIISDNAEYLAHRVGNLLLNYLFSFPTDTVTEMPLGLNVGIMSHEYTHMVMRHVFYEPGIAADIQVSSVKPTINTLGALEEGLGDYFGFLTTGDPGFFKCSFPEEDRDLTRPKYFTVDIINDLKSNKDPNIHRAGAVFAAINYEIGNAIGVEENGRLLARLMPSLLTCSSTKAGANTLSFDFADVASCHASLSGNRGSQIQAIYSKYLGQWR